uniref:Uncharacterized protein n=1 Tax=Strigamia maritima TaxID=126957 RepID=T1JE97_STRMM
MSVSGILYQYRERNEFIEPLVGETRISVENPMKNFAYFANPSRNPESNQWTNVQLSPLQNESITVFPRKERHAGKTEFDQILKIRHLVIFTARRAVIRNTHFIRHARKFEFSGMPDKVKNKSNFNVGIMKFIIISTACLFFLLTELSCSVFGAEEGVCFNVEQWRKDANKTGANFLQTAGLVTCQILNIGDETRTRSCMRSVVREKPSLKNIGATLPIWYPTYKNKVTNYAVNADGKEIIEFLLDDCRNADDNAYCPEIYEYFRAEVKELGYDV